MYIKLFQNKVDGKLQRWPEIFKYNSVVHNPKLSGHKKGKIHQIFFNPNPFNQILLVSTLIPSKGMLESNTKSTDDLLSVATFNK